MSEKLKTPAPSWKQILSIPKTPFLFSTPFIGVVILLAYIIGILGLSVLWSAPLLFAVHFVNERRATLVARQCAQKTIQSLEDEAHLKVFLDGLNIPSWVYVSDTHKMGWFNQTVARLWPFISRALTVKADKQNEKLRQSKRDFDDAEGPVDGSEETDEDEGADTDSADEEDVDFSDFDLQISEINKRFNSGADGADLADVSSRCSTPSIEDGLTEPEPNDEDGKTDKTPTETEKSEEVGKKKKKKWRKSRLSSLFVRKKDRARKDGRKGYQFVGGHAGIDVDGKGMDIDSSISRMDMSNIIQLIVKMREKIESIRLRKKTSTEKRGREERKKNKKNEKRKTAKDSAKKDTQTEKTDTKHQKKKKVVVIQHIADFDIGDVPPMITGFKVYPTRDDEDQPLDLTVDVSFSWVSNMRVTVKMAVKGLPMSVALSNVQLVGTLRLECSPLVPELSPPFNAVKYCWKETPLVDFDCSAVGLSFMDIPVISRAIKSKVVKAIERRVPTMPLKKIKTFHGYEDDGGIDSESCPTGMLTVVLLEARGLPKADIFSNSDPFCVLSLSPTFSEESQKSKSKIDTNDPVWNESFEFFVEDFSAQELKLDFFDKGFLTRRLGSQTLRLADLTPSHPQQVTCHLTEQGVVHATVCFQPLISRDKVTERLHRKSLEDNDAEGSATSSNDHTHPEAASSPSSNKPTRSQSLPPSFNGDIGATDLDSSHIIVSRNGVSTHASPKGADSSAQTAPNPRTLALLTKENKTTQPLPLRRAFTSAMDVGRSNQMGGYLLISNVRGSNLKVADIVSSDPYMILSLGSIKHKSKVKRKTLNPAWKSTFKFRVSDPITEVLRIQLYDHDYLSSHDSLGYVEIPVREVCDTKAQKVRKTYTLLGVDTGKLTAELVYRGIYNI